MKFIRFKKDDFQGYGLLEGERVKRIEGDIFKDYKVTDCSYSLSEADILIPCIPSKIVCIGLNYKGHALEMDMAIPEEPIIFLKPASAALAHKENIKIPKVSKRIDYECEMGIVIGRPAGKIEVKDAHSYIFGATCFNDVTARDIQKKDGQWTRAKSFYTFAPFGPCIGTDLDYDNLDIELLLNGKVKQKSNTSDFIFDVAQLVSFVSHVMFLNPGDVIATGTPSGIGEMKSGDTVQIKIEGIGTLENYVE